MCELLGTEGASVREAARPKATRQARPVEVPEQPVAGAVGEMLRAVAAQPRVEAAAASCAACGEPGLPEAARFCPRCGAAIR